MHTSTISCLSLTGVTKRCRTLTSSPREDGLFAVAKGDNTGVVHVQKLDRNMNK